MQVPVRVSVRVCGRIGVCVYMWVSMCGQERVEGEGEGAILGSGSEHRLRSQPKVFEISLLRVSCCSSGRCINLPTSEIK